MAETILNPRRVPRAPARCEVRCLLPGGGFWASDTTDLGPKGCQLAAPGPFHRGDPVKLVLTSERVKDSLAVSGSVAWASSAPPWRIGITFDQPSQPATVRWFEELVQAYPGLATFRLAPDFIEVTATIYLGPAPRVAPELSHDEVAVLKAVGPGVTVEALRARFLTEWPALEGALFTMIGKKLLTVDQAAAGAPEAWATYLH